MIVCIDPGHGRATDPGAIAWEKMTLEADLNLDIALHLELYLTQARHKVILTHRGPEELKPHQGATAELQARCDVANTANAGLFVSVHVDSCSTPTRRGTRCWYYPGSVKGKAIATVMADTLRPLAQIAGAAELMTGIADANFYVLHWTDMPAVLVECGFMSNITDVALLREPGYRDKVALCVAIGILRSIDKGLLAA